MKKLILIATTIFLAGTSCQEKIDIQKEKEAIKAVIEQESNAYFNQDYVAMGETIVKEPSSVKMYMYQKGQFRYEGWDKINAQNQKETSDTTWNRKLFKGRFLNYKIDVMDNSAWVLCDKHFEGIYKGESMTSDNSRIYVLKKVDNKWKIALIAMYIIPKE
jgi:hypothetical protein